MRVLVIGAGAAGLAAARHVCASHEVTVFEQTYHVGGTWVYTDEVGTDASGYPVHTSMYKSLRTNLPKEVMGFPDFPIKSNEKSYLPAKDILQFLNDYMERFNLKKLIKFGHQVKSLTPADGGWAVVVTDRASNEETCHHFDAVMVCNGHYSTPNVPQLPGADRFQNEQLHCHDYRSPERFAGKTVVVIGAGPSGMDLTLELASQARQVIMSHHLKDEIATVFPRNVVQKPDVAKVGEKEVTFEDGSTAAVDVIFYCTGYKYSFPFLSEECKVSAADNYVQPLYKHLFSIEHPTMCFIGLPFYVCAFSLFDLQARVFLRTLEDASILPGREAMLRDTARDMELRRGLGFSLKQAHQMGPLQGDYYQELAAVGRVKPLPPVLTDLHNESSRRFLEDLVHYREDVYDIIDEHTFVQRA